MPKGVLEIELGACLTAPTKSFVADLHELAYECNVARNGVMRHWLRWREDNPDWEPGPQTYANGEVKYKKKGGEVTEEVKLDHPSISSDMQRELYRLGTEIVPNTHAKIVSQISREIQSKLKSRMPYNHEGKARFFWDALLKYEVSVPTYRNVAIPALNSETILCYEGATSRKMSLNVQNELEKLSGSTCLLRLSLRSKKSGKRTSAICRIEVRQKSKGHRNLIRRVANGELKLSDSNLVFKRNKWFFQMTYDMPVKDHHLDTGRVATLELNFADEHKPFVLISPEGKKWYLGDQAFQKIYEHYHGRRMTLRSRYKHASSSTKGHGKGRFYRRLKPYSRAIRDLEDRFTKGVVADIIKRCVRWNCGELVYREPTISIEK
jgi:hypothetical protein